MLNGLDLFSGIGGIGIGLSKWVRTVAYCEQDRYAQGVLLSRMQSGEIDRAPIWDDINTLRGGVLPEIDIIFGGFPCQDISTAGTGKGLEGERSGLFFQVVRLASELRPKFIFLENVPAITVRGLDRVCLELTALGYDCRWTVVSAAEVGAPHQRDRWFLLAYSDDDRHGKQIQQICERWLDHEANFGCNGKEKSLAYTNSRRRRQYHEKIRKNIESDQISTSNKSNWWSIEPDVGRVANGIPFRNDRIRCLGNSVVPQSVEAAFRKLAGVA